MRDIAGRRVIGWLLLSDLPVAASQSYGRDVLQPQGRLRLAWLVQDDRLNFIGNVRGSLCQGKTKGLEEETLVTSSNPVSQVLW
jgi:hypothetical protein